MRILFSSVFNFLLVISIQAYAADVTQTVSISVPRSLSNEVAALVKLEVNEKIELTKALSWRVNAHEYYFLPISYKRNQGCRFVFINGTTKKIISDGDFFFEQCTFTKPPEVTDINKDGYQDFKVWLKLPHHTGSKILVLHNLDYIYHPEKELFCERDMGIPCASKN